MLEFPQIPGYKIEKELGQGGMASVYLAHDENLEREIFRLSPNWFWLVFKPFKIISNYCNS